MTAASRSRSTSARPRSHHETEPLLAKERVEPNPLPKAQLAVIYAIKLTLPIALTQSMPYYNVLIGKLAASEGADTGYYSGVTVGGIARAAVIPLVELWSTAQRLLCGAVHQHVRLGTSLWYDRVLCHAVQDSLHVQTAGVGRPSSS